MKGKKLLTLMGSVCLILVLAALPFLTACPAPVEEEPTLPEEEEPAPPEKPIKLTFSILCPADHPPAGLVVSWAIEEIKERTNGRVEITLYPVGSLTPSEKIYAGVVGKISDMGESCLAYTRGRFPASEALDLPMGYPSGWVATHVVNDFYDEFKPDEFDDVHVLCFHGHGPGVLQMVDKRVYKLEDLEGMVIRSTGLAAKIVERLGAVPRAMPMAETYEALAKGVVDGSLGPRETLKGWKQAEVVKYVTNCEAVGYTTNFFVVINKDTWDELSEDIQEVFTEVFQECIEKFGTGWDEIDKEATEYLLTFEGREVIELSEEEISRWTEAVRPLIDSYIAEKEAMGLPAADYVKFIEDRIAYWSARQAK